MEDGTTDTMRVTFPADETFARIGRVAIAGLALRLDIDVQRVENLRLAVDAVVAALGGDGEIVIEAFWSPGELILDIENRLTQLSPERTASLHETLPELVDEFDVKPAHIELKLFSSDG